MAVQTDDYLIVRSGGDLDRIGISKSLDNYTFDELFESAYCSCDHIIIKHLIPYTQGINYVDEYSHSNPIPFYAEWNDSYSARFSAGNGDFINFPTGLYVRVIWLYADFDSPAIVLSLNDRSISNYKVITEINPEHYVVNINNPMRVPNTNNTYGATSWSDPEDIGAWYIPYPTGAINYYDNISNPTIIISPNSQTNTFLRRITPYIMFKFNGKNYLWMMSMVQNEFATRNNRTGTPLFGNCYSDFEGTPDGKCDVAHAAINATTGIFEGNDIMPFVIGSSGWSGGDLVYSLTADDDLIMISKMGRQGMNGGFHSYIFNKSKPKAMQMCAGCGLYFKIGDDIYKPIIKKGFVDSYTNELTDSSDIDGWSGSTKHTVPDVSPHANIPDYSSTSDIWIYNLRNAVTTDANGNLATMDIAWTPTPYPKNNSEAIWMNTDILAAMSDDVSDLERINMLKKIYTSNTKLYDHLRYMMRTAQSKRQYDIYKIVFDSFMQTEANRDFYKLVDTASGNPVYTDGMDNSATYHIVSYTTHVKDSEGFPKYDLLDLTDNTKSRYDFTHNSNYSFCRYVNMTTLDVVECVYNEKKYSSEGVKEYYVTPDYTDEFPRGYMYPNNVYENNQKVFVLAENTFAVLQNTDNKKIVIPVVLAEDGTIASYVEGTTEIVNGTVTVDMVDEERVHVLIEYDGEDPIELTIKPEWKVASDYYEYLQCRNIDLYNHLIDLKYKYDNVLDPTSNTYKPSDEKRQRIEALCEMVAMALEKYFDKKEWKYLFNIIPTANMQNIQSYIMKMVIFFKSWKTQMLDTSVTYQIDDKYENQVRILDDIFVSSDFGDLMDKIRPKDIPAITSQVNYKENVEPGEKVDIKQSPFYGDVTSDANGNLFP